MTAACNFVAALILVFICAFDARFLRVPNVAVGLFSLFSALPLAKSPRALASHFAAAVGMFIIFFAVRFFSRGIGFGDVKLAAAIGLRCGFLPSAVGIFFASLAALLLFAAFRVASGRKIEKIPFAPFLAAGCAAAEFFAGGAA